MAFAQINWNTNSYSNYDPSSNLRPSSGYDLLPPPPSANNVSPCDKIMIYVKSNSYGTTYNSFDSEAISSVTFYETMIDYKTYYFAIVCFKNKYSGCSEYIYQVSSNIEMNYSINYRESVGKTFWTYIQPYNENLTCAPNFD